MKITERRLRQIIRQVIKESKINERSGESAFIAVMGVICGIKVVTFAIQGMLDLAHILHDHAFQEYCAFTGGTDFKGDANEPLNDEALRQFAQEGITVTLIKMHDGHVLELESLANGSKYTIALSRNSILNPKTKFHRRQIADLIGYMYTGDKNFDSTNYIMPQKGGRSKIVPQASSTINGDFIELLKIIYGRPGDAPVGYTFGSGPQNLGISEEI